MPVYLIVKTHYVVVCIQLCISGYIIQVFNFTYLLIASMKKILSITVAFLSIAMAAKAQENVQSLTIGFAPVGSSYINISLNDEKYEYYYTYKPFWNVDIGYERQFKGVVSLTELFYLKGAFDRYELDGTSQWFNPAQTEDLTSIAITQYTGKTFNQNKRLQIPFYIGVGGEYMKGGPLHNVGLHVAAKARMKFYITNNIGIFVGATCRYGYGMKGASDKSSEGNKNSYSISHVLWGGDGGLIIGL
jgi:hypothetical protein